MNSPQINSSKWSTPAQCISQSWDKSWFIHSAVIISSNGRLRQTQRQDDEHETGFESSSARISKLTYNPICWFSGPGFSMEHSWQSIERQVFKIVRHFIPPCRHALNVNCHVLRSFCPTWPSHDHLSPMRAAANPKNWYWTDWRSPCLALFLTSIRFQANEVSARQANQESHINTVWSGQWCQEKGRKNRNRITVLTRYIPQTSRRGNKLENGRW
jgi:hypothetical protein